MPDIYTHSDLPVDAGTVLASLTMTGVNTELWPLVRMTTPRQWSDASILDAPVQQPLFASWILLFGWLPVDRHRFRLDRILPGAGFDENSDSLVNAFWQHSRRVESVPGGSRVTDTIRYRSRLPLIGHLMRPVYALVFRWRHRRLRTRWGTLRPEENR